MEYSKHQIILEAIEALKKEGSWTGKTHVQKTLAMTSFLFNEDFPFEFVLYKHGPYSFDVDQELDQMLSYDAVRLVPHGGYGPSLSPSKGSGFPTAFGDADEETMHQVKRVAKFVGSRNVVELEALATAAWIRTKENLVNEDETRVRLKELKPHLSDMAVRVGVQDADRFFSSVKS
jgi:hypothetical protein